MQIWLHKHVCSPYMHSLIPVLNIFCNGLIEQIGIYQVYSQILYCLFCIIVYDGKERKPQNIYNYWFLVGVLILLSGIQYRMGADIILYMTEYNYYEKDFSISYLFGFSSRRPLWVLFNILCKSLGFSFVVFKSIIALFVNIVIAKFIVRRTKYIYTALLVYFLILYFHFNFNFNVWAHTLK